ncbi:MAG: TfoX/Sxy family protein [Deltaproteobacteria bacterium]|nr:TfoX/Sxy family protein [Deltaproteobacteria bacterium]
MSYDEKLAERLRERLLGRRGVTSKEMFGGVAYMLDGKMFVGIVKDELMVRVGPARHDEALDEKGARTMDFTGKPMRGYVFVAPAGYRADDALDKWIAWASSFVATLPEKKPHAKKMATQKTRGSRRGR